MEKGKCYSMANQGQRNKDDFYQTPYSLTEALLKKEKFRGSILEPACGNGAISKILNKYYRRVYSYDIFGSKGKSFFYEEKKFNNIITNPPFKLANQFILKCKKIAKEKFALLLPM